jgi:hypothetical protein
MKKLTLFFLLTSLFMACSGDDDSSDDIPLIDRMPGARWNLTGVEYFSVVPNPDNTNQMIPINGNGEQVSGSFYFRETLDSVEYDIRFTGVVTLPQGNPVVIPVERTSTGAFEFSSDNKKVFLYQEDTLIFDVRKNSANEQVWSTTIPHHIQSLNHNIDISVKATMRK